MPKFVPVADTETPRSEQSLNDDKFAKHRKFDNPHLVHSRGGRGGRGRGRGRGRGGGGGGGGSGEKSSKVVDRGWEAGSVGWGVRGFFGSADADSPAPSTRKIDPKHQLVKDERTGRWMKPKDIAKRAKKEAEAELKRQIKESKQNGTYQAQEHAAMSGEDTLQAQEEQVQEQAEDQAPEPRKNRSRSRSRSRDRHRSGRHSRSRSRSRDRSRRRSRSRSRSRSRDRYRRRRSRSRSYERRRRRSRSRSPRRRRSRSRSRDRRRRDDGRDSQPSSSTAATGGKKKKRWDPEWGWV